MTSLALLPAATSSSPSAPASTMDHGQSTMDAAAVTARNRANAQHSTGPRTPAGKARSDQNARTHGLSSTTPPTEIPVPDPTSATAAPAFNPQASRMNSVTATGYPGR